MLPPNFAHLLDWNSFSLRHKVVDEESHYQNKEGEEDEQSKLHITEHRQEDFSDKEGEQHIN